MEITCYRDNELSRESHQLPAASYNLAKTLLARSPTGVLFVPIRPMQYLAILDNEEFVFIDSEHKNLINIAWQNFQPQKRDSLDDPVAYEAAYYYADSKAIMHRLLGEFPRALQLLAEKEKMDGPAKIIKLNMRRSSS